ncbi:MAG: multidrug effflux MFS transporter [Henriciella sp.]
MPLTEFVVMIASLMSVNALAIDTMLPALGMIADHYRLAVENDQQLVVFAYVLGFGAPQLVFGPVSDRFGRKRLLQICLIGYMATGFYCMFTQSFAALLGARFIQGVFASGVRVVAVSIVRDLLAGRQMARVMSLSLTIFMAVPILAPSVGSVVLMFASWQWTFGVLSVFALVVFVWMQIRLPETLKPEDRKPFTVKQSFLAYKQVLTTRVTFGYMCAGGVSFGALFAFIASCEQIFRDVFDIHETFALWFAGIAIFLAVANFVNSRIVERIGMRRISHTVTIAFILMSLLTAGAMQVFGEKLFIFYPLFGLTFACFGMMGANFSALAMEPLGKIAGTASAAYGFASTTVASGVGYLVASRFDGTVTPVMFGYTAIGIAALIIILITEKGRLFTSRDDA